MQFKSFGGAARSESRAPLWVRWVLTSVGAMVALFGATRIASASSHANGATCTGTSYTYSWKILPGNPLPQLVTEIACGGNCPQPVGAECKPVNTGETTQVPNGQGGMVTVTLTTCGCIKKDALGNIVYVHWDSPDGMACDTVTFTNTSGTTRGAGCFGYCTGALKCRKYDTSPVLPPPGSPPETPTGETGKCRCQ